MVGNLAAETIDTRIGKLEFTHDFANGYPIDATVEKLFNELDFQRAVQAYIWSIPLVSMAQWQYSHEHELGTENGQIVLIESYTDRAGVLRITPRHLMYSPSSIWPKDPSWQCCLKGKFAVPLMTCGR